MDPERWKHVKKIVAAALERKPEEWPSFLARACGNDDGLRTEVEGLLSAHRNAGEFMKSAVAPQHGDTTTSEAPIAAFATGQVVSDRYEILRFIGRGGMGEVYEAKDLELRTRVALKTIRPEISADPRTLARFRDEIKLARRITHRNICRVFHLERCPASGGSGNPDITFITMELLEGENLSKRLGRQGRMSTEETLPLVRQMAEGLAAAHDSGVVHCDFKPGNVMLVSERPADVDSQQSTQSVDEAGTDHANPVVGATLRAVITDFGLARAMRPTVTRESIEESLNTDGRLVGTLPYMAPEQLEGCPASPATDVYALGLVIYEMVTGRQPFSGPTPLAAAYKRLKEAPPPPRPLATNLDPGLESVIERCLQTEPTSRFASAHGLVIALDGITAGRSTLSRRRPMLVVSLLILAFALALALLGRPLRVTQVKEWAEAFWSRLSGGESGVVNPGATVFLTDVKNDTGDPDLNGVTELLRNALEQSAHFNLMSPSRVCEVLQTMGKGCGTALNPATAREVAMRDHVPRVVFGTVAKVSEDYVLNLDIEKPDTEPTHRRQHWTQAFSANSRNDLFDRIRDGSDWVRKTVGEAQNEIDANDRPTQDITTDSWQALDLFFKALEVNRQRHTPEAINLLKQAVEIDSEFAMAYMRLGDLYDSEGDYRHGYPNWRKALSIEGARRLTLREQLLVKGVFAIDRTDLKTALEVFSAYQGQFPNDYRGFFYSGYPLMMSGRPEEAIQKLEQAHQKDPTAYLPVAYLPAFDLILNRFDDAARWSEQLRSLPGSDIARYYDAASFFMRGEPEKALNIFREMRGSDDAYYKTQSYYFEARVLAELGRTKDAMSALKKGIDADIRSGSDVYRAEKLAALAYLALKAGDREGSRNASLQALQLDLSLQQAMVSGSLLARAGFVAEAQHLLAVRDLGDYSPISDVVRHRLQGEIFLAEGRKEEALVEFRRVDALDMPARDRDYLARVYLALNQPERAWVLYRKVVDAPGQVWQQAEITPPGFWGDTLCQYATVGLELGKEDAQEAAARCRRMRGPTALPGI